jgi:hypothetical protein
MKILHQSKDEQRKRFLKRIDNPEKNWKLSIADIEERTRFREAVVRTTKRTSLAQPVCRGSVGTTRLCIDRINCAGSSSTPRGQRPEMVKVVRNHTGGWLRRAHVSGRRA